MFQIKESNFTFNGKHCLQHYGCWFLMDDALPITPEIARTEYIIPGAGGSLLLGSGETDYAQSEEPMELSGRLVMETEPKKQSEAMRQLREIQKWLRGRHPIIFDHEPDKYYMAQIDEASTYSYKEWFGGMLSITIKLQPVAYGLDPIIIPFEYDSRTDGALPTSGETGLIYDIMTGWVDSGRDSYWDLILESCDKSDGNTQNDVELNAKVTIDESALRKFQGKKLKLAADIDVQTVKSALEKMSKEAQAKLAQAVNQGVAKGANQAAKIDSSAGSRGLENLEASVQERMAGATFQAFGRKGKGGGYVVWEPKAGDKNSHLSVADRSTLLPRDKQGHAPNRQLFISRDQNGGLNISGMIPANSDSTLTNGMVSMKGIAAITKLLDSFNVPNDLKDIYKKYQEYETSLASNVNNLAYPKAWDNQKTGEQADVRTIAQWIFKGRQAAESNPELESFKLSPEELLDPSFKPQLDALRKTGVSEQDLINVANGLTAYNYLLDGGLDSDLDWLDALEEYNTFANKNPIVAKLRKGNLIFKRTGMSDALTNIDDLMGLNMEANPGAIVNRRTSGMTQSDWEVAEDKRIEAEKEAKKQAQAEAKKQREEAKKQQR